ncbi:MAG TPA: c-type cytochrome [Gammaproteobacteria bacterium]|nr:c-type cytochrome [Gammaproteobacteria bacterium]
MKKWFAFAIAVSVFGVTGTALAKGDAAAGKAKSTTCAACHGADGNSANPMFPKLAGQGEEYIIKQLHDFKSGARKNATMQPMAAPLSDQDIEDLAAYFSSQKTTIGKADPKLVDAGQALYRGGDMKTGVPACMGCHTPDGAGNPAAKFPMLHGQHAKYVVTQLKAFRAGERHNDAGKMMRNIAEKLTDHQIEAVASYIQGLH